MKKISRRSCVAACTTLALLASGSMFLGNNTHAAATEHIYLNDGNSTCTFYKSNGTSSTPCDTSYGTYDQDSRTLTINSATNNTTIQFGETDETKTYTIKASTDIETGIAFHTEANYIFDIGNHTWTVSEDTTFDMPFGGSLLFKSGTYNIQKDITTSGTLTIDGAQINMLNPEITQNGQTVVNQLHGRVQAKHIAVIDGQLIITNNDLVAEESLNVQNGNISITNEYGAGGAINVGDINTPASLNMTGGTIRVNTGSSAKAGIKLNGTMTISDGILEISDTKTGISAYCDSKFVFNGGTTTITNSQHHAIYHDGMCDTPKDITELEQNLMAAFTFGNEIGIKESDLHIFLDDSASPKGATGIVAKNTLTIAKGYDNRKVVKGWEIGYGEPEDENIEVPNTSGKGIKAPDTGAMDTNHKAIAIVATAVFTPISLILGYIATKVYARKKNHVSFKK